MYRRRRPQHNKIVFSFDSFLDVVTNVIGIIIRLILVTWVGAQAYTETMLHAPGPAPASWEEPTAVEIAPDAPPPPLPAPRAEDDPISKELFQIQAELNKTRNRLTKQLKELDLAQAKVIEASRELTLADIDGQQKKLEKEKRAIDDVLDRTSKDVVNLAMSKEEILQKAKVLQEEIRAVEKLPTPTKVLRYHTPVSRPVRSEELHFECLHGRVAFIDVRAFIDEITDNLTETSKPLERTWKVEAVTSQIGDFRLRYFVEREREFDERIIADAGPAKRARFHKSVSAWKVEPVAANRGESIESALKQGSAFRQIIDRTFAQESVVTLWVYPDSFAMFRRLRDFLHERDIEVAARPIPEGATIGASRDGTASRGQ
jgi:hypothetical protein